jgi:ComF family protein
VKALIKKLKFERSRSAADVAARLLLSRAVLPSDVSIVTAVPIAPSRYRERGYNQAELIAKRVAVQLGLPYRPLLGRENADHQIGRDRQERLEHIQGVFFATSRLAGQRILIVDDVMTTGATLAECATVLSQAGAEAVWVSALARR